jgi:hypothetical protein
MSRRQPRRLRTKSAVRLVVWSLMYCVAAITALAVSTLLSDRTSAMGVAEVVAAALSAIGALVGAAMLTVRFLLRPRRRR